MRSTRVIQTCHQDHLQPTTPLTRVRSPRMPNPTGGDRTTACGLRRPRIRKGRYPSAPMRTTIPRTKPNRVNHSSTDIPPAIYSPMTRRGVPTQLSGFVMRRPSKRSLMPGKSRGERSA